MAFLRNSNFEDDQLVSPPPSPTVNQSAVLRGASSDRQETNLGDIVSESVINNGKAKSKRKSCPPREEPVVSSVATSDVTKNSSQYSTGMLNPWGKLPPVGHTNAACSTPLALLRENADVKHKSQELEATHYVASPHHKMFKRPCIRSVPMVDDMKRPKERSCLEACSSGTELGLRGQSNRYGKLAGMDDFKDDKIEEMLIESESQGSLTTETGDMDCTPIEDPDADNKLPANIPDSISLHSGDLHHNGNGQRNNAFPHFIDKKSVAERTMERHWNSVKVAEELSEVKHESLSDRYKPYQRSSRNSKRRKTSNRSATRKTFDEDMNVSSPERHKAREKTRGKRDKNKPKQTGANPDT